MGTCRLCLWKTEEEKLMISVCNSEKALLMKIKDCVSIEIIEEDQLPSFVCSFCIQKVNDWFEFKEMCIRSNEILKTNKTDDNVEVMVVDRQKDATERASIEEDIWKFDNYESDADQEDIFEIENDGYYVNVGELKSLTNFYKCDICSKEFDTCLEYLDHQNDHNGEPVFQCDKCSEVFTMRKDLVSHDQLHKKPCPHCGKMILKSSMKLHLNQHTDKHMCSKCSHRFCSRATLQQHIITMHTDIKDHICESCGKRFSSKTAMNVHLKSHSDERLYACKLCDYAGRTSSALYIHMATHTNEVHFCEVCPKSFKSTRNLKDHLRRVHSKEKKHKCSYCGKKFVDRYMLTVHTRCHTGVKPFKCKLCDKAFIRSDSLKEHMATHGERTMYNCSNCLKKFTSKRGVARHHCLGNAS